MSFPATYPFRVRIRTEWLEENGDTYGSSVIKKRYGSLAARQRELGAWLHVRASESLRISCTVGQDIATKKLVITTDTSGAELFVQAANAVTEQFERGTYEPIMVESRHARLIITTRNNEEPQEGQ